MTFYCCTSDEVEIRAGNTPRVAGTQWSNKLAFSLIWTSLNGLAPCPRLSRPGTEVRRISLYVRLTSNERPAACIAGRV